MERGYRSTAAPRMSLLPFGSNLTVAMIFRSVVLLLALLNACIPAHFPEATLICNAWRLFTGEENLAGHSQLNYYFTYNMYKPGLLEQGREL